jgi:hypothetical protein
MRCFSQTTLLFAVVFIFVMTDSFGQKDNLKKNTKISKKEEARYQKDLKEHPNSPDPHWRHAKIVGAFQFQESEEAWKYYQHAIEVDSTIAAIWVVYGDYLVAVLGAPLDALYMYERALALDPGDNNVASRVTNLKTEIEGRRETIRLRSLGVSERRKIEHGLPYRVITNFDSLRNLTGDSGNEYFYDSLLARFMRDEPLNEWQTYLLCLGYTKTKAYAPYSDTSSKTLYELNSKDKYEEVIGLEAETLKANPVSGEAYRELMYAYRRQGDEENGERCKRRAQRIYDAMIFTGDGTCDKPYVTLTTIAEYSLINYLGLYASGQQALMRCGGAQADRLSLDDENNKDAALYFNVALLFRRMQEMLDK